MALNWGFLKNFIDAAAVKITNDFLSRVAKKVNGCVSGPASATAGNIAILGETGKTLSDGIIAASAVLKCVNRQDSTSDNTVSDQLIQMGWGYIQGNDSTTQLAEEVTFPEAFDSGVIPIVLISSIGRRSSVPSSPGAFNGNANMTAETNLPKNTKFSAILASRDSASTTSSSSYYGYSWIAIGTKTRS